MLGLADLSKYKKILKNISAQLSWLGRPRTYKAPRWGRQGRMYSAHTQEMTSVASLITRKSCKEQTETRDLSRPVLVKIELFFRRPKTYVDIKRMTESTLPSLRRTPLVAKSPKLLLQASRRRQLQTKFRLSLKSLRVKFVLDVLQRSKILNDDKFVCSLTVAKYWCNAGEERTEVELVFLN